MEPKTHKYFSIPAKYSGSTVEDLELSIQKYGDNVVRMQLLNRVHKKQCGTQLKRFLLLAGLASLYYGCILAVSEKNAKIHQAHILYPALLWLVLAFKIVRNTLDLVHSEKIFYSWDMALQTETVRTFGRKSVFCVQRGHLHDIVLNEVIENLDIKYMLILRTKGSMFNQRPIIPLFNSLSPSFECLKQIHRILHGYWLNNNLHKAKKDSRA
ncbi:LOW QUALITY PROTEIN: uncharacterized protein LOC133837308 [Drosophila sulfurigaster albostrigata]|uniref:LOW QUALITY PROTEIN: uncharacterized protein LOC133837308 n=1 Tax=Drosophila sulfurigaster albostrigata TaxID=89887 RepID=UPI002D21B8D5|nr:LOW QUALITY PROTEIN: uncharacterized protein LOC133837308 [Drosophila sulfurigaster albostrigata]